MGIGIPCGILGRLIIGGGIGVSVCSLHDKQLVGVVEMIFSGLYVMKELKEWLILKLNRFFDGELLYDCGFGFRRV